MKPIRALVSLAALLATLPVVVSADPVEISDQRDVERGAAACSVWVEPAADEYKWTFVCGSQTDEDGDGSIDARRAIVFYDICQENDPEHGSFCSGGEVIAQGPVTSQQLSIDVAGGTAGLHAMVEGCAIEADWTATDDAQSESGEQIPPSIYPYLDPPAAYVVLRSDGFADTFRHASLAGTVCPQAGVSGVPKTSLIFEYEQSRSTRTIKIDPTA